MNRNIILIGYMGAGKTTLGKQLAKRLGRDFCDLDWYIEEKAGRTIPQIFAEDGEDGFRRIERQMLHEALQTDGMVISVGGGTPCFFDNIDYMNQNAATVYLHASSETLRTHIRMGGTQRPLVDGKSDEELLDFINESLKRREPFYQKADHEVKIETITADRQIAEYVDMIIETIKL